MAFPFVRPSLIAPTRRLDDSQFAGPLEPLDIGRTITRPLSTDPLGVDITRDELFRKAIQGELRAAEEQERTPAFRIASGRLSVGREVSRGIEEQGELVPPRRITPDTKMVARVRKLSRETGEPESDVLEAFQQAERTTGAPAATSLDIVRGQIARFQQLDPTNIERVARSSGVPRAQLPKVLKAFAEERSKIKIAQLIKQHSELSAEPAKAARTLLGDRDALASDIDSITVKIANAQKGVTELGIPLAEEGAKKAIETLRKTRERLVADMEERFGAIEAEKFKLDIDTGKKVDAELARILLEETGGDKDEARRLATERGLEF